MAKTRTVTWAGGGVANEVEAVDNPPIYTTKLTPGQVVNAEFASNGFDTGVNRIVKDESGKIVHNDWWYSHYSVINGQLEIGVAPAPEGAPAPQAPAPPAPAPTAEPAMIPAPPAAANAARRRRIE